MGLIQCVCVCLIERKKKKKKKIVNLNFLGMLFCVSVLPLKSCNFDLVVL